jgi:hypothetical protein
MNQLSRIIMGGSSGTPDEQAAAPDERGSYGELMEEIDRLLAQPSADERERPAS